MKLPNLPNMLTISRILFVLVFVVLATVADKTFISSETVRFGIRLGAYILAIIAGGTDLLDGYLARRWNQVTDFGALMDPLADKIFVTATMLIAVECRLMPAWIVIAVLCREEAGRDFCRSLGKAQNSAPDADAGDRGCVVGLGVRPAAGEVVRNPSLVCLDRISLRHRAGHGRFGRRLFRSLPFALSGGG